MNYKYEQVDRIAAASASGDEWQMKYERVNDLSHFTFNGKTPPRRILRCMVKDCKRLSEQD